MEKPKPVERTYPEQRGALADFHAWDAHKKTRDLLYDLHDKLNLFMHEQKSNVGQKQQEAGGPSNTKIAGIFVQAIQPKNGQTLKYNSSTGQLEWS